MVEGGVLWSRGMRGKTVKSHVEVAVHRAREPGGGVAVLPELAEVDRDPLDALGRVADLRPVHVELVVTNLQIEK